MPSVILAGTTTGTALSLTSDTSGELQIQTNNGATTAMTLTTGGNVGIGTSSPTAYGSTTLSLNSASASAYFDLWFAGSRKGYHYSTSSTYNISTASATALVLETVGSERMRITSAGLVGINTASPTTALQVNGTITAPVMADTQGGSVAPISSVMRNRIINGAMVIDQRNAGASVLGNGYPVDRWQVPVSQSAKLTAQQNAGSVTPPVGFTNYAGVTSSSAYSVLSGDFFLLGQRVEGFNIADFGWGTANASAVTLSFWVRSSLTGTFGGSLQNSAQTRTYPYSYTISAANTWEQKTVTIAGDTSGTWLTNNGVGVTLWFSLGVGSSNTGTAGAWAASSALAPTGSTSVVGTNGATFYITGVQLERGTQATSFEYRQYGQELALCQRYYYKNSAGGFGSYAQGTSYGTTSIRFTIAFPVTMRIAPSSYDFSAASTFLCELGTSSSSIPSAVGSTGNNTPNTLQMSCTVTGATASSAYILYSNGTSSFIGVGAEL
jgi:hypothetical protein